MPDVDFGQLITAASDPPRALCSTPAFVHRTAGDVLFVSEADAAAANWFPGVPLGKLLAAVSSNAEWIPVPKHTGRLTELGEFVREWLATNGFTELGR